MSAPRFDCVIVAALPREVRRIVHGWSRLRIAGAPGRIYCSEKAALLCAGTGRERAYQAARLMIEKCAPKVVLSIGFAGGCDPSLAAGALLVPSAVIEVASGLRLSCSTGSGVLATLDGIAGRAAKAELAASHAASAVDMEASGVARAARESGVEFAAIKAVSDGCGEELDFLSAFTGPEGFATGRFLAHVAPRPWLWPAVAELERGSRLAALALAEAVADCLRDWPGFQAKHRQPAVRI